MTDIKTFYKGFDENMQCRGFQYAEGETYTQQGQIGVCVNGFHACALPLDVWAYYPLREGNLYHEVTLDGIAENDGGDSKVAAREITVGASLNLVGLISAHVEAVFDRTAKKSESHTTTTGYGANAVTTGDRANAVTTGDRANAVTTGDWAHATTTGYGANAVTTGRWANAVTTGDRAHATTTGYGANAVTIGDRANAVTTGDRANAVTTGDRANAVTTGRWAHAATTGRWANAVTTGDGAHADAKSESPDAIAAALGRGKAKGVLGGWLVLTERDAELTILDVQAIHIDGTEIKPDTWYRLVDGEPVEA